MSRPSSAAYVDSKPHYEILDGLRGVAALLVVFYHIFEGLSFAAGGTVITVINHGYLAVDFFFILSGFVIGYAYDDRWGKTLTLGNFFKRRLIRLHPMIVMGAVLGVVFYVLQGCEQWDGTHVGTSMIMLALLCALFFIPATPGSCYDIRGNGEMFPLNGPSWSLFFEYIGNLLYALFIHRLSTKALTVLVVLTGLGLAWFMLFDVVGYGMIGVGWTLDGPCPTSRERPAASSSTGCSRLSASSSSSPPWYGWAHRAGRPTAARRWCANSRATSRSRSMPYTTR